MAGGSPDVGAMMGLQGRMMTVQPIILLITVVAHTLLIGAVYRAVLQPTESRFGYLRVGRQELWLGLTLLVFYVVMMLLVVVAVIPVAITSSIIGLTSSGGVGSGVLIGALLGLVVCVAVVWVLLRLSLALPMSFAQSRFVLPESWALTRGHTFKMFLVALALVVIVWLLELVLGGLFAGAMLGQVLGAGGWEALADMPPGEIVRRLGPLLAGFAVVGSILGMAVYAVLVAPWASIYAQFTAEPQAEA